MEHDQRRVRKVVHVPINHLDLILVRWEILFALRLGTLATGRIPLSPTADGTNIHMINIRRIGIAPTESLNEPLMVRQKSGIVVVREFPACFFNEWHAFFEKPLRRPILVVRYDPES